MLCSCREIVFDLQQPDHILIMVHNRTGYSEVGGPLFILMKAAQWRLKPKMIHFPGLKIPGSEVVFPHCAAHRASALEILSETSHFTGVITLRKYIQSSTDVSFPV